MNEWLRFRKSVAYAWSGVIRTIRTEPNMRIHLAFAGLVPLAGWWLQISRYEWLIVLGCIALVISLELVNTAIEATVDLLTTEYHPKAKVAKDAGAAAVLIAALFSAIIGLVIFVPPLWQKIANWLFS
ncbi:diacylglycerol kinase family protein [Brevibacillus fulvus]|uniref:Diacylglycerol kinase n=1 Tax=Brevibacillus fulvus TaxID=1125967 RepID=A0A938XTK8_9BACL|nr:diacylglycerol kinase family protein [Brevibacillus fulvus]MBM7589852.1 diacylglycerol kinase [Brevibacillus fulvus]